MGVGFGLRVCVRVGVESVLVFGLGLRVRVRVESLLVVGLGLSVRVRVEITVDARSGFEVGGYGYC